MSRSRDLDHGDTGANVDEKIRIDVWRVGWVRHEGHRAIFAVREDFVGDLVDKEVEACVSVLAMFFPW